MRKIIYLNIKDLILETYIERDIVKVTSIIIENPVYINDLIYVINTVSEHPYPQYGSWLLHHVLKKDTKILKTYINEIIDIVLTSNNPSVLRNLTASIILIPLNEYKESELLERLIFLLQHSESKPALRVNSIYKLIQFTQKYPDIKSEILNILDIIEEQYPAPSIKVAIREYRKL